MTELPPPTEDDVILYTMRDGYVRWQLDSRTSKFIYLWLPKWLKAAPGNVRHDAIEWCRARAVSNDHSIPLPESVRVFRDAPATKAKRAKRPTLEAWT